MKTITQSIKEQYIVPGEEKTIFEAGGSGVVTHMWFGGSYEYFDDAVVRVYYDGSPQDSFAAKLFLMHGIGFQDRDLFTTSLTGKTGNPSGVYNCYRIPYGNGIRITVQMDERAMNKDWFWSIVRATEGLEFTLEGKKAVNARLMLQKTENRLAEPLEEFPIYTAGKNGCLFMTAMTAESGNLEYQESCFRGYFDGEMQLLSSGMEDYFLGTYYFMNGKYQNDIAGVTHLQKDIPAVTGGKTVSATRFSGYRFHERDPVFFGKDFTMTIRCGECIDGKVFHHPQPTLYSIYVFAYEFDGLI